MDASGRGLEIADYFSVLMANKQRSVKPVFSKFFIILEMLIVTFLFSILPELIELGRPPKDITEIYTQILSAVLMALYAYIRIRNVSVEPPEEE